MIVSVASINEKNSKCNATAIAVGAEVGSFGGPVGVAVGVLAGAAVVYFAAEHTKGARKSTHDKHTKPRPGRPNEKKRLKPGWKPR